MSLLAVLLFAASTTTVAPPAPQATPATPEIEQVSPDQMKKESDEADAEMQKNLKRLLQMMEKARTARDVVLLNCLNEKLTKVKALIRVGEQASVNLQEFLAKDQLEAAGHERRKIGLAREKVKSLLQEAETCLEEAGAVGGKTVVTVEKPAYEGDPTHIDEPQPGEPETPPSASPYQ